MRTLLLILSIVPLSVGARLGYANNDAAIRAAIQRTLERSEVKATPSKGDRVDYAILDAEYARRGFTPLWLQLEKPTPQALALLRQLQAADAYGLRATDYASQSLVDLLHNPTGNSDATETERLALFDVSLSTAAVRFLTHLHFGRVAPRTAGFNLGTRGPELDVGAVLSRTATAADVDQVVASVEPQFYHYRLLRAALTRYRELAATPGLSDLPALPGRSVKPGESYAGAPALRKLLRALGDLNESPSGADDTVSLDPGLVAALKRFQERHGIEPDGALGRSTFAALTKPLAFRVRQIELTLERWRWLPPFDAPPIIVNIPQFRLFAFRSTQDLKTDILQMDVIVGRSYPKMRTPVFAADMRYVVFRPYWDVPDSILKNEMLPQIRSTPGYLAAQHLEIVRGQSDIAESMEPTPANITALASGKLRLRQKPGADNALGLIKFMLPNSYNVYLHSTPAHRLFSEPRRAFSHGCIRVSDPAALAVHVLQGAPGEWDTEAVEAAMNGETTLRVNLARPIRVLILYGTALATEAGTVMFFDDIYGHDRKLESLLRWTSVAASPSDLHNAHHIPEPRQGHGEKD